MLLNITYKSKALMKVCTDYSVAVGKHGEKMARKIHQRTNELEAADSLETLVKFSIGRCHRLKHNRKGQYAMDLTHPYRLVIEQDKSDYQVVRIINIEDYH